MVATPLRRRTAKSREESVVSGLYSVGFSGWLGDLSPGSATRSRRFTVWWVSARWCRGSLWRAVLRRLDCGACLSVGTVETRGRRRALTLTSRSTRSPVSGRAGGVDVDHTWSSRLLSLGAPRASRSGRARCPSPVTVGLAGAIRSQQTLASSGRLGWGQTWPHSPIADKSLFLLGNRRRRWCIQPIGY